MIEGREWPAPKNVVLEPALVVRASTTGSQALQSKSPAKTKKRVRPRK
jgi:hypothetical protein